MLLFKYNIKQIFCNLAKSVNDSNLNLFITVATFYTFLVTSCIPMRFLKKKNEFK